MVSAGRRNLHASRVRSPGSTRSGDRNLLTSSGLSNGSKINFFQAFDTTPLQQIEINFFQPLRLRGEVEGFPHRFASRMPDARKKTGILCGVEQRLR